MPDIYHLVFIKSTPEKIYKAVTTQEGIASWWSPYNDAKPEAGSVYHISFGSDYYKEIKVIDLIPNKKVNWHVLDAHPEWVNTKIVFDMRMNEDLLELRFKHSEWKEYTDMFAQCNHHWGIFLLNLKTYVEKGEVMSASHFGKDIPGGPK